jgi:peroxiredoxin Q/BCP
MQNTERSHHDYSGRQDRPGIHKVMTRYDAFGEKKMYGKTVMGVIRSTVWVAPDGKVRKHWRKVAKAADHPQKVLEVVQAG